MNNDVFLAVKFYYEDALVAEGRNCPVPAVGDAFVMDGVTFGVSANRVWTVRSKTQSRIDILECSLFLEPR